MQDTESRHRGTAASRKWCPRPDRRARRRLPFCWSGLCARRRPRRCRHGRGVCWVSPTSRKAARGLGAAGGGVVRRPRPCPSPIGWERGKTIVGGVTQGGARSSLRRRCRNEFRRGGAILTSFSGTPPGCFRQQGALSGGRSPSAANDHRLPSVNPSGWERTEFILARALRSRHEIAVAAISTTPASTSSVSSAAMAGALPGRTLR